MNPPLGPSVEELIEKKQWSELRALVSDWPAPETAELLLGMDKSDRVLLFRFLPRPVSTEVFAHLSTESQVSLVKELTDEETRQILANLEPDDRTHLLEEMPGRATQRLLNLLSPEDLVEARKLLGYPEESVGRLMTPDYVAVRAEWTIERSLEHIRKVGKGLDSIATVYVTDPHWKLLDEIELQQFVLAAPTDRVDALMDRSVATLSPYSDREEAVGLMGKYDLVALPVVDSGGVLLGVVAVDDVMDVAEEEATEDFQKSAAVEPLKMSYEGAGVWSLYRKRIPWLALLVLVNLAASSVIAAYEETLSATIALVFFIPLLIGSGGNAGAQAATLMVRALATGDVREKQWPRTLLKELAGGGDSGGHHGSRGLVLRRDSRGIGHRRRGGPGHAGHRCSRQYDRSGPALPFEPTGNRSGRGQQPVDHLDCRRGRTGHLLLARLDAPGQRGLKCGLDRPIVVPIHSPFSVTLCPESRSAQGISGAVVLFDPPETGAVEAAPLEIYCRCPQPPKTTQVPPAALTAVPAPPMS